MEKEKMYKIYYGENENEYITRYLKESDIINGYLTEYKAFELFYSDMIMCNEYLQNNYDNLDILVSGYNEEEDYYEDEYQVFIIDPEFDEEITENKYNKLEKKLEKMRDLLKDIIIGMNIDLKKYGYSLLEDYDYFKEQAVYTLSDYEYLENGTLFNV